MRYLVDQDGNEYYPQAGGVYVVDTESGLIYLTIHEAEEHYISTTHTNVEG